MEETLKAVEEFECSICMDGFVSPQVLPCGHFFCKKCEEMFLQFEDDGDAILECPKKCSPVANIKKDQTLDDVLQKIYAVESFVDMIRSGSQPSNVHCQEEHQYKIPSSRYCKTCRKTSCKSCFDEHACGEGNNHINIAFDYQQKAFQPICEQHKSFARYICKECNDQLICVYCKHRTHKDHDIVDLDSHVAEIKRGITAEIETDKKFPPSLRQSEEEVMKHFQEFREKLSEELLFRKIIRVNRYIAQQNEEESKILKQFDDHADSVITKRKSKLESVADMRNLLDDQNNLRNLVMLSEQEVLLEILQDIIKQLSLKVVLSDLTDDNHLGELQIGPKNETISLHHKDIEFPSKIMKENANEMVLSTDLRNAKNFQDEIMKKRPKLSSEDIYAIIKNGQEVANLKLAMAFDPKLCNESDFLKVAVENNQWKMLKVILECKNFDIDTKYEFGLRSEVTALMIAAKCGNSECVKLLLAHNCDIDMKDKCGYTALIWASQLGYSECVKLLLAHNCDSDMKDKCGYTALIWAIYFGHSKCVKLLLAHNCDIDMKNNFGYTALMCASRNGHSEDVKLLLAHNCDIDMKDNSEKTALMYASQHGHSECVKLLLAHNCDIDMKNNIGYTALMYASQHGHSECVKLLLAHNCDIDMKNKSGITALMCASQLGRSECVKLLNQYKQYGHLKFL